MLRWFIVISFICFSLISKVQGFVDEKLFNLGVRSGDPSKEGFVLWTRINEEEIADRNNLPVKVKLQVYEDEQCSLLAKEVDLETSEREDFTVKSDVTGLNPKSIYYYRFKYGADQYSRTGRAKTLPGPDYNGPIRLLVLTCQNKNTGDFNLYNKLALDAWADKIDYVYFSGDEVYEYESYDYECGCCCARRPRAFQLPSEQPSAINYKDFRAIRHEYLKDKKLQDFYASIPVISIHDDHEIANNWYGNQNSETKRAVIPGRVYKGMDHEQIAEDGLRAFELYTPIRCSEEKVGQTNRKKYFRSFLFGQTAKFLVTDSRSFRDGPDKDIDDPEKTMLGQEQLGWFMKELADWREYGLTVWGNQTMFERFSRCPVSCGKTRGLLNVDQWDGYQAEQDMIRQAMLSGPGSQNRMVWLEGDMHTYQQNHTVATSKEGHVLAKALGLMTPAVTSPGFKEEIGCCGQSSCVMSLFSKLCLCTNRNIKHFDADIHGYLLVTLNKDHVDWQVYDVSIDWLPEDAMQNLKHKCKGSYRYIKGKVKKLPTTK
ncbi:alkaline phosphatase D family protein [Endozoicomonas sp. Mp262]|uniref:alkaline phosphatase D family protein n=1 Tax=Endozoicomonas sp. Mp262 TaxID=2919499 RepID=UPI0021DB1337